MSDSGFTYNGPVQVANLLPWRLHIQIMGSDGRELLALIETEDGHLDVTGDPANYTEAARQFIDSLTEMARATVWPPVRAGD